MAISTEVIEEVKRRLVEVYNPVKIYLFGSYAWGCPTEDSDLDLLIIVDDSQEKRHKRGKPGIIALWGLGISKNLMVYTQEEFESYITDPNSRAYIVARRGKVLFSRTRQNEKTFMKRRTFYQNKLWRDGMVAQREQEGSVFHYKHLSDSEYQQELGKKLMEEAEEVLSASSRENLIEELADVLEVIDAICKAHGLEKETILATQIAKRMKRGGFEGRKFVETVEHPEHSSAVEYCLKQPEKYPEIT